VYVCNYDEMYPCLKYEKIASTDGSALDGRESARAETEILNHLTRVFRRK